MWGLNQEGCHGDRRKLHQAREDELLAVLDGDLELCREEHPICEAGIPQLRFHREVCCSLLRDLGAKIRVDVYVGSMKGKRASLPGKLQDALLGLIVVDSRDERAGVIVLFLRGDCESVCPVNDRRGGKGVCAECFFQKYLHECGWLPALRFLGYAGYTDVIPP